MTAFTDKMLACLCEGLSSGPAGPVCWCGLVGGSNVAMHPCGPCKGETCGMAFLRLNRAFPSNQFPLPALNAAGNCQAPLAYEWHVGAYRCFPVLGAKGEAPSEAAQADAALRQLSDMTTIHQAILCCVDTDTATLGTYTPVGPSGGCGGGQWSVFTREA